MTGSTKGGAAGTGEGSPVHRRSTLTREQVLATALRLIDDDGVEALSMRRLGRALGRDPMRLYRFAASKDELLDGVVELVLSELEVPDTGTGWEDVLRRIAHAFRGIALAHPHVVPLLVTRPLATPLALRPLGTLRPLEDLLELLISAGFDERDALHAYRLYMGFLQGHVLNELQERVLDPEESDDLLRLGLHRLPVREFPRLRSLAAELAAYDGVQELDEGLDVVLGGLRRQLDSIQSGSPHTRPPAAGQAVPAVNASARDSR
jgi:AcrR family transcriptional regulator